MRVAADDEKIEIGGNRNAWSARQLQRVLDSCSGSASYRLAVSPTEQHRGASGRGKVMHPRISQCDRFTNPGRVATPQRRGHWCAAMRPYQFQRITVEFPARRWEQRRGVASIGQIRQEAPAGRALHWDRVEADDGRNDKVDEAATEARVPRSDRNGVATGD